jgi:hypothetical protein
MRGGRLGSLLAVGSLGFAEALTGCGGDAFTSSEPVDGGAASAVSDANGPDVVRIDAAPPPVDAGAGWCATQTTTHTFCEDFLRGVPDKLVGITVGAMLVPDTTDFESAPQSMAAVTPSLPKKGDSATALATHDFSGSAGTQFALASYFKIASSCFPANGGFDPVSIAIVEFPEENYALAIDATPSGVELVEVTTGADGGVVDSPKLTMFNATNLLDSWQLWTLTIDGTLPKSVALTVGGATVIPARTALDAKSTLLLQHPTLLVGAAVKNDQGLSNGCRVNVDDILFDVKTLSAAGN